MNGIHDLGGMQDMGPIRPEKAEPVFHAPWEGRMYALWMAVPGDWSISADRYQKELIPPADYLQMSYYEKIMTGLVDLMVRTNMVTPAEIRSGKPGAPAAPGVHVIKASEVTSVVAKGSPSTRNVAATPHFHAGQQVRARVGAVCRSHRRRCALSIEASGAARECALGAMSPHVIHAQQPPRLAFVVGGIEARSE
jgi:nitrile hydratase subunit beta